ncbi:MAG: fatty acid desaturase [Pseudomonadota bacterium]
MALIAGCYASWGVLTWFHADMPFLVFIPLTAYVVALHSSIQHEVMHGHPTRNARLNEAVIYPPIGIVVPYRRFKALHLRHHCDERLTDPYDDPESWYVCPDCWDEHTWFSRTIRRINATLAGRLTVGPLLAAVGLIRSDMALMRSGQRGVARAWLHHFLGLAGVLIWLQVICGMSFVAYLFTVAYPALSLLLLRSYAEHRAAEAPAHRTAIIEASPVWSFLFLFNNLHAVHHSDPRLPWYKIPAAYRSRRDHWRAHNNGYGFAGYGALMRHSLFRPHDRITHPFRRRRQ